MPTVAGVFCCWLDHGQGESVWQSSSRDSSRRWRNGMSASRPSPRNSSSPPILRSGEKMGKRPPDCASIIH
uniref:Putative secreted protein n=1 Tax=Anopheles triannulatus TaxID=58253 RepID=A0A2M4B7V9_9DIPT